MTRIGRKLGMSESAAVYTVRFEEAVYVLHCFQKRSKSGIATPKQDFDLVRARLKEAEQEHEKWKATKR